MLSAPPAFVYACTSVVVCVMCTPLVYVVPLLVPGTGLVSALLLWSCGTLAALLRWLADRVHIDVSNVL